ncbi:MAG: hypothetical protein JWN67_432 [Actinomycetia bacterium]|nr:hypothetical protein [Actinomycetes bacterium]
MTNVTPTRPRTEEFDTAINNSSDTHARLKAWDLLRNRSVDLTDGVQMLAKQTKAYVVGIESAYSTNAEMVATAEVEAADLTMVSRLLDHHDECARFMVDDAKRLRETLTELSRLIEQRRLDEQGA